MLISQIQRSGGTLLEPALRRSSRVPRGPLRAEDRLSEEAPLAAARPRPAGELVRVALQLGLAGAPAPAPAAPQAGCRPQRLPVPLPAEAAEGDLRCLRGRAAGRERAGRARLLLHLVLQRLARQPEPLHRAEEGGGRVHAAAGDGAGEPRALLRRLPRRDADLDRPRPARLVRVGRAVQARALRRTSTVRWACGGRRPRPRSRRASATANACSCSPTSSSSSTRRRR